MMTDGALPTDVATLHTMIRQMQDIVSKLEQHSCADWRADAQTCPVCSQAIWPPVTHRLVIPQLKPDDVIVYESSHKLSSQSKEWLSQTSEALWPGRKVLVLDSGMSMTVVGR